MVPLCLSECRLQQAVFYDPFRSALIVFYAVNVQAALRHKGQNLRTHAGPGLLSVRIEYGSPSAQDPKRVIEEHSSRKLLPIGRDGPREEGLKGAVR